MGDSKSIAEELLDALESVFNRPAALYGPPPDVLAGLYGPAPDPVTRTGFDDTVPEEEEVFVEALYGPAPDEFDEPVDLYGPYPDEWTRAEDYPNILDWNDPGTEKNYKPATIKDIWKVWREMRNG